MIHVGQPTLNGHEAQYVNEVLRSNRLTMGPMVDRFERALADWLNVPYARAVSNGTAALHLALLALGIGPGDEVIIPSLTFVATANAVRYCGAQPVFVDVHPASWTIDPTAVKAAVTARTRAIIPVHLYGMPADLPALTRIGFPLVEDAAEAIGTTIHGVKAGAWGDVGCFSFYGNKTLTTGEGGMVVTHDPRLDERIALLRGQGQAPHKNYWHTATGYNYRLTELQAAIGLAQVEQVESLIRHRVALLALYKDLIPLVTWQTGLGDAENGAWAAVCLLPRGVNRDAVRMALLESGIETRPAFYPVHTMPMYSTGQSLPVTDQIAARGIMLPLHGGLTPDDVEFISAALNDAVETNQYGSEKEEHSLTAR
jgi:perosamine synthetase